MVLVGLKLVSEMISDLLGPGGLRVCHRMYVCSHMYLEGMLKRGGVGTLLHIDYGA